jgi:hypothetical protein
MRVGVAMPQTVEIPKWYHSNKYAADTSCEHCGGVVRHEPWCITSSPTVAYAYAAVLDADTLTMEDRLILHALGAAWTQNVCTGKCASREGNR